MTREAIFNSLTVIFRDVFDDDNIVISDSTTAANIEGWDSLEHLNLIVAIEEEFGLKFTMEEVVNMRNVGNVVDRLEQKL